MEEAEEERCDDGVLSVSVMEGRGGEKRRRSKKFFLFSANFMYPFVILRKGCHFRTVPPPRIPSPILFEGGKEMAWQEYGKSCFFLKRALGKR